MSGRLSLANIERLPADLRPNVDPRDVTIGTVHLGEGAFHRAHQLAYTELASQKAGELHWGTCGVSQRSAAVAEALTAQDGLYSLTVKSPAGSSVRVMVSLRQALFAQGDGDEVLARLADPAVQVVTLTVTEKGYRYAAGPRRLRADDPDILLDAAGRPPVTVIGQLARGLEARYRQGGAPLSVLSCDNITANGRLLGGLVREFLDLPGARFEAGASDWVAQHVTFPCTMVDRIVPATTGPWREEVAQRLGLSDLACVVTEPFSQWVVEDRFASGRPRWEDAGAEIVADVSPYEALKLRALNGAHSALAYLGLLAGCETIAEALERPGFEALVRGMLDHEVRPTLDLPAGVDFAQYRDTVLERFANTALPYRCLQVAGDGSQKLPQRCLGVVRDNLRAGRTAPIEVMVVAAWLRAIWTGLDDGGRRFEVDDPFAPRVREVIGAAGRADQVVERVLGTGEVFGTELASDEHFKDALVEALTALLGGDVQGVVAAGSGR